MTAVVLWQLLVLLSFSVLVVAAFRRFSLPPILGYLAVCMVLGPSALNLTSSGATTQALAEFGVVFLVFTLGLEFSLRRRVFRRDGIVGRQPSPEMILQGGDVVVLYGAPEALDRGETRLLAR
jgi:Kef-type K+ transport system membrane component KefB